MSIIQLGPLRLSTDLLFIFLSVAGGYAIMSWRMRTVPAAKERVLDTVLSAFLLALLTWKISLAFFRPSLIVDNPLALLYLNGGWKSQAAAALAFILYIIWQARKHAVPAHIFPYALIQLLVTALGIYELIQLFTNQRPFLLSFLYFVLCVAGLLWFNKEWDNRKTKEGVMILKKFAAIAVILIMVAGGLYTTLKTTPQSAKQSAKQAIIGIQEGNQAPDFTLKTPEGETKKLSDFRGQKVILNIWATWCPPCRAEMPDMQKFYTDQKDNGVVILAVNATNTEKSRDRVPAFMKEYGLTFPVVLDETGEVSALYQANAIPTSYILDTNGIIHHRVPGAMSYDMMEQLIRSTNE